MEIFIGWLPPAVTIAVLLYFLRDLKVDIRDLKTDMRDMRAEMRELGVRVSNIDSRVSRIEGLLEGVFHEKTGNPA